MKKFVWLAALITALVFGFVGCGGDDDNGGGNPVDATWELSIDPDPALDANNLPTVTTTHIIIKFNKDVALALNNITLSGSATKGSALEGGGKEWKVPITVSDSGDVSVQITKTGIVAGTKTVVVYKQSSKPPTDYTAVADGTAGAVSSSKITLTFTEGITGLLAGDISITPTTTATKGALGTPSNDGKVWDIGIETKAAGNVTVKITKTGISAADKTVAVFFVATTWDATELTVPTPTPNTTIKQNVYVITGDDLTAIKTAYTANPGVKLRVTYFTPTESPGTDRNGWGMGAWGHETDINKKYPINAPNPQAKNVEFAIELWAKWGLEAIGESGDKLYIFTSIDNKDEIRKIELLVPSNQVTPQSAPQPPQKPEQQAKEDFDFVEEIDFLGANGNPFEGKGDIEGQEYTKLENAPEGSVLRFYIINTATSGYPGGSIGGQPNFTASGPLYVYDVSVAALLTANPGGKINVNVWNGAIVALCELWKPQEGVEQPKYTAILEVNGEWGYQGFLTGLFDEAIATGDEYKITMKFESDKTISGALDFFLLDNSEAADWWNELSGRVSVNDVTAGIELIKTINITATKDATSNNMDANKLTISCGTGAGGVVTLKFWELEVEKVTSETEPLVIFDAYGAATGVTMTGGTLTDGTYVVTPGSGPSFSMTFVFSPALDISEFSKYKMVFDGVHAEFKQMNWNVKFFDDQSESLQTQTDEFKSKTGYYTFGDNIREWGNPTITDWEELDLTAITKIEFYTDFMQSGESWDSIPDGEAEAFILKSFSFE
jgi:hypothetical protein